MPAPSAASSAAPPVLSLDRRDSEHARLKRAFVPTFLVATAGSLVLHALGALFAPPYVPTPYRLRAPAVRVVEVVEAGVAVADAPPVALRPDLPREVTISEEADPAETMAPTGFDPNAPPATGPAAGGMGSVASPAASAIAVGAGSESDASPEPVYTEAPVYSGSARRAGARGTVLILVTVGLDGRVREAVVRESDAGRELTRSALEAARRWRFRPARRGGHAVEARLVIPFRFSRD